MEASTDWDDRKGTVGPPSAGFAGSPPRAPAKLAVWIASRVQWPQSIRLMRIIRSVAAMSAYSRALHREGVGIGFVPTMGALHAGHRALIRTARLRCDAVIVSIFVNPTQFGPQEDFSRYPRRFKQDAAMCREEDVDVIFAPSQEGMYRPGFQ